MRIKKTSNTRAIAGKVLNVANASTTDTYSCDYINDKLNNSIISDYETITSGSAWQEIVTASLSLSAGTYIIVGQIIAINNNALIYFSGDGTNGSTSFVKNNSFGGRANIADIIKITSTTTIKLCMQTDTAFSSADIGCRLKAIKVSD